jgi:ergothioneine biosynthesis protein EgtB
MNAPGSLSSSHADGTRLAGEAGPSASLRTTVMQDPQARRCGPAELALRLQQVRARLLGLVDDLAPGQWQVPLGEGLNPLAWELAHVAWFAEWWTLRGPHRIGPDGMLLAARAARVAGPDAVLDSSRLPHAQRWAVRLPSPGQVRDMLSAQLEASLDALSALPSTDEALYFHRLALMHEAMHCEALVWMRSTLGYPPPREPSAVLAASAPGPAMAPAPTAAQTPVPVAGGPLTLGSPAGAPGFFFDNEQGTLNVELAPFDIDPEPVSAGCFLAFVQDGGYDAPRWWPGEAGRWRGSHPFSHPARWRRHRSSWQVRHFERWLALDPQAPASHLSAWEAQAWCLWAGRTLPSAAQWQLAAQARLIRWGDAVWEWTSDDFLPYPGFRPGPYRDYSQPWFGSHRELRGGAFASSPVIRDLRYRNFFLPGRTDLFTGFRSASLPKRLSG